MADNEKTTLLKWAQYVFGAVSFGVMLYLHVFVKELPTWLLAAPWVLLGIDPTKLLGGGKK